MILKRSAPLPFLTSSRSRPNRISRLVDEVLDELEPPCAVECLDLLASVRDEPMPSQSLAPPVESAVASQDTQTQTGDLEEGDTTLPRPSCYPILSFEYNDEEDRREKITHILKGLYNAPAALEPANLIAHDLSALDTDSNEFRLEARQNKAILKMKAWRETLLNNLMLEVPPTPENVSSHQ